MTIPIPSGTQVWLAPAYRHAQGLRRPCPAGPGDIEARSAWRPCAAQFLRVAGLRKAPIAIEAIAKIDGSFAFEREINGQRHTSAPLYATNAAPAGRRGPRLPARAPRQVLRRARPPIDYNLKRWEAFTRYLTTERCACPTTQPARAAPRGCRPQELDLRRLRRRRPLRCCDLLPDPDREAQ